MPTINGNYLIEVDGVAVCRAHEIEQGGVKHENFELYTGDAPNPILGRGKYSVDEVTIKHAMMFTGADNALATIFQNYIRGIDLFKPTIRIVTLDEDGSTPVATDEYIDCVPTMFQPDNRKGDSKDNASVTIKFKPSDHIPSY